MKHTPGPWKIGNEQNYIEAANARLIAAAPEMYACLEEMVNMFEGFARIVLRDKYIQSDAEKRARAVINRVEGRE